MSQRIVAAGTVLAVLGAAVILLWSDRTGTLVSDVAAVSRVVARRIESMLDVDLFRRSDVPWKADQVAHAAFWGSSLLVIAFVLRRRVPVLACAVGLGLASLVFEMAQPIVSRYRGIESGDIAANLVGITLATAAAIALRCSYDVAHRIVVARRAAPHHY